MFIDLHRVEVKSFALKLWVIPVTWTESSGRRELVRFYMPSFGVSEPESSS